MIVFHLSNINKIQCLEGEIIVLTCCIRVVCILSQYSVNTSLIHSPIYIISCLCKNFSLLKELVGSTSKPKPFKS